MALASFKPILFLAELVVGGRKTNVAPQFCNLEMAVALKDKGTKMTINTMGDVTVANTNEAVAMTYVEPDTSSADLEITIDKTVAVKLNDNDLVQIEANGGNVEKIVAERMNYKLQDEVDQLVFGAHAQSTTNNYETGTTPWQFSNPPTAADLSAFGAAIHKDLDDNLVPQAGRFLAMPNIGIQAFRAGFGRIETQMGDEIRRAGLVTQKLLGFDYLFQSANVALADSVYHALAGPMPSSDKGSGPGGAIALAIQIAPTAESLRLEGFWSTGFRARVTAGVRFFKPAKVIDVNLNSTLMS